MAEPIEDKNALTHRIEEDRVRMATQVSELKKSYDLSARFKASVTKEPWYWIAGALLTGFLLSRLPARRKTVFVRTDFSGRNESSNFPSKEAKSVRSRIVRSVWSLLKPIITAYIGREIYQRVTARQNVA
jgi:hypothetical protein